MNRLTVLLIALAGCLSVATAEFNCKRTTGFPKEVCYIPKCTIAIRNHIQQEFNAAFKYMYMGAHFAQDTIDRPGLAKFLLEAASEERGHAIQMLDYLNLRGIKIDSNLNYEFVPDTMLARMDLSTLSYKEALEEALNMEIEVTDLIYNVVTECADDYHGADVFTNPILDEQHNGVRKLEGAVHDLNNLLSGADAQGKALAEYIFDHKMLSGEF